MQKVDAFNSQNTWKTHWEASTFIHHQMGIPRWLLCVVACEIRGYSFLSCFYSCVRRGQWANMHSRNESMFWRIDGTNWLAKEFGEIFANRKVIIPMVSYPNFWKKISVFIESALWNFCAAYLKCRDWNFALCKNVKAKILRCFRMGRP